jgi:hypothetical protein
MKDEPEVLDSPARVAGEVISGGSAAEQEVADRTFLLECRLDQLISALQSARTEADRCRTQLAANAAREADHARRASALHDELAQAREEIATLHRSLEHSEALRADAEGRLFESGQRDEAAELARLRRDVCEERERTIASERASVELRTRVEELTATRETLLTRIAEWQSLVRRGDPYGVDLSEFIAGLRGDILELEHQNALAEQREAQLREQLVLAGVVPEPNTKSAAEDAAAAESDQPGAEPAAEDAAPIEEVAVASSARTDNLAAALEAAGGTEGQIEVLLRLGKSKDDAAFYAIRPWATAPEPRVRAAAFEALGRLLEGDPTRLEPHLRWGLADADPRVRRRVVLAAASARGVALRPLLEPLRADPDPQVRRVTLEVLRRTSKDESATESADEPVAVGGFS